MTNRELIRIICDDLDLILTNNMFVNTPIMARIDEHHNVYYCAIRLNGDMITLTGRNSEVNTILLSDPTSIDKIITLMKDNDFIIKATDQRATSVYTERETRTARKQRQD